ncbi:MAG TPA: GNAT family N-acetyltransferase [Candidatus Binataceae bacterium]
MACVVRVVAIESAERLVDAHAIRRRVFIEEQHVPEELELDEDDQHAVHALALMDGRAVGCGRFVAHGAVDVKIGRMAVLAEVRGTGIGQAILEFLLNEARQRGFSRAVLHAQLSAEGFYLKQGFLPVGEVFEEAGISHRKMERSL